MYNEGFGTNGIPFEYTVAKDGRARSLKRFLLVMLYVLWVVLVFTVGVIVRIMVALLCFIPLSLWIMVFLTWRLTKEEYKITLFGGIITVTRTYDGRNPKKLLEARLKDVERIVEYSQNVLDSCTCKDVVYAVRNTAIQDAYIAVWSDRILVFETNEKALKIIRYYQK